MLFWSSQEVLLFVLLVFRMAGLMVFTPLFGSQSVPVRIRVMIAVLFAYATFSIMPRQGLPNTLGDYFLNILGELAIGSAMGILCLTIFSAMQYAGRIVDQQLGFALSELIDPFSNEQGSLTGQIQFYILMLIYLFLNGHLRFLEVFFETISRVPLGFVSPRIEFVELFSMVLTLSFHYAIYFAAPILGMTFLVNLALGFIARAVPNMNVLILGFPIKILMGISLLMIAFGQIVARAPDLIRDVIVTSQKITNSFFAVDG